MGAGSGASLGVYVHVPFCASRCDYCAFATWTDREHLADAYAAACVEDLRSRPPIRPATSVYVGGGTPSRLDPILLSRILQAVPSAPGAEVTVECNPEDAAPARLEAWRAAGVTRVSLGVQSMAPHVLAGLGRRHDPAAVAPALAAAAAVGIGETSVDLIFGGAGETDRDWRDTLELVLGLEHPPAHVSAYALTVEPGTPLARDRARHPDDDTLARRYETADAMLGGAGFRWYEVSNWARPGHECRHNLLYWEQGDYLGVGCAAHSHLEGRRWWNVRTPERYIDVLARGATPVAAEEHLDERQRAFEALALALRTSSGVPASALADDPALHGLVERVADRAVLTLRGRLLANEVTLRIRPDHEIAPPILPAMARTRRDRSPMRRDRSSGAEVCP
jgi:putative oxygen-independent coproporphyrinogen III oxidase